ncbi:MAG: OmpA family protein [Bacteroidetes bacterium]|nr:OmpA family protein [Bacteroidota bacterium]
MIKTIPILLLSLLLSGRAFCQFGGLINKAKNKINQRVDQKVDKAMDKGLDKAEGKETAASGANVESTPQPATLTSYSKYDFVPGEQVLYAEDFAQEAVGELPTGWNSTGSGEVSTLDKFSGRWLRLHKGMSYLTANSKTFGTDYTLEFDLILQLKNNGWMYPQFLVSLVASRDLAADDNSILKDYRQFAAATATIAPFENNSSRAIFESFKEKASIFKGDLVNIGQLQNWYGTPMHVAIQVQKQRFRCWINELKAFDVPKGVPTADTMNNLRIEVGATNYAEENYGVYISNIRIATGLPDTRHKLIEEGKFTTNGILFDANSAVIRPESAGVLKEIGTALKENPSFKVRIIGHTSSDGDDAANLELSKKRAAAVKDFLGNEWKIDGDRIETEGKGETAPIADNKTKDGRAQNRRVEFIKQ